MTLNESCKVENLLIYIKEYFPFELLFITLREESIEISLKNKTNTKFDI